MDIHLRERTELLKSLEARNNELAEAFAKYRETEKAKWPELGVDGELIDEEDGSCLKEIYWNHRTALQAIRDIAGTLKQDIENLLAYFEETPEQKERKERIAAILKRRDEELKKEEEFHTEDTEITGDTGDNERLTGKY